MDLDPRSIRKVGRFEVRRWLGGGPFDWAFEVEDPQLFGTRRALFLSRTPLEESVGFEHEARLLASIRHPNLIPVHDFGFDEETGLPFLTMEFVERGTLADLRMPRQVEDAPGRFGATVISLRQAVRCFDGVLAALDRLHGAGVVHRDVKPHNVFLTRDGIAQLGGLGVAVSPHLPRPEPDGQVLGTASYMAPENVRGEADSRSDLFAVGLSLYRVLCGRSVYDEVPGLDPSSASLIQHLLARSRDGEELELRFPEPVPAALREVIRRAVRIDPAARFADAAAMREALEAALDARPPEPPPQYLAAVVKADVVAYSRLMAEDEERTVLAVGRLRERVESLARKHGGRVVDFVGDNFLAEFPATVDAARFALATQQEPLPLELTMGIHLGDVRVEGDRLYGSGINVAARLEPLAEPRGICVSGAVREQLRGTLPLEYEDRGERELKNLPEPVHVYRVRVPVRSRSTPS